MSTRFGVGRICVGQLFGDRLFQMAYRLKPDQSFDAGVRRIGLEQIDRALHQLQSGDEEGKAIHETRKALKRIRALFRLVRPGLSSHVYAAENARYRDIGRLLSGARDSHVLIETVNKFETLTAGRTKSAFAAARNRLSRDETGEAATDRESAIAGAIAGLTEGREVMAGLVFKDTGIEVAIAGMARTYRRAARAFEQSYKTLDGEDLHEWRKFVQHHWRQMSLLAQAWPEMAHARVVAAKEVSNLLGEDHDISVMLAAIEAQGGPPKVGAGKAGKAGKPAAPPAKGQRAKMSGGQQKLTHACAVERQAELRAACHKLGQRLFAEPADAFAERMRHYWASAETVLDLPNA